MERWAIRSACGRYRWLLGRTWDASRSPLLVVGLNPSTADGRADDPTTRRCIDFAQRWGHGGLLLANLYAWRTTRPPLLAEAPDPVGPQADAWLLRARRVAGRSLAAWGNHGLGARAEAVEALGDWWALGTTGRGAPRHPLYVRADTVPVRWP